jgi:hypothetical protein
MLRSPDDSIEDKRAIVSRSRILELIRLGTISWSDSKGNLLFHTGMKLENVDATNKLLLS